MWLVCTLCLHRHTTTKTQCKFYFENFDDAYICWREKSFYMLLCTILFVRCVVGKDWYLGKHLGVIALFLYLIIWKCTHFEVLGCDRFCFLRLCEKYIPNSHINVLLWVPYTIYFMCVPSCLPMFELYHFQKAAKIVIWISMICFFCEIILMWADFFCFLDWDTTEIWPEINIRTQV